MERIIAIASGKGGVGKSTVAANLAVALANGAVSGKKDLRVGLLDLDFYGPSIPTLMGGGQSAVDTEGRMLPADRYGVKFLSIAFFLQGPDDPVIWRGPMLGKAIGQLFADVKWGEIDICVVDLPPGTGDAQLSLAQSVKLDGALIVTTPQEVALSDVRRAINMFGKVKVPILGIVENMNGFITPTGERFEIFGSGGGKALSERFSVPLMASFPLDMKLRESGDSGQPLALDQTSETGKIFVRLAEQVWQRSNELRGKQAKLRVIS